MDGSLWNHEPRTSSSSKPCSSVTQADKPTAWRGHGATEMLNVR